MNLDDLTLDQLRALAAQVQSTITQIAQQAAADAEAIRTGITQVVATRVLAIRLLMQGLEVTARSARDIARVVGK